MAIVLNGTTGITAPDIDAATDVSDLTDIVNNAWSN